MDASSSVSFGSHPSRVLGRMAGPWAPRCPLQHAEEEADSTVQERALAGPVGHHAWTLDASRQRLHIGPGWNGDGGPIQITSIEEKPSRICRYTKQQRRPPPQVGYGPL